MTEPRRLQRLIMQIKPPGQPAPVKAPKRPPKCKAGYRGTRPLLRAERRQRG